MALPLYPGATWDPFVNPDRSGIPWSGSGGRKLVLHTTETPAGWNPNYRENYGPHITCDFLPDTPKVYQHVRFDAGSYAMVSTTSACGSSVNYGLGQAWQVELIGFAAQTPSYPDRWYQRVAEMVTWMTETLDVPPVFPFAFDDGDAFGCSGSVRLSCSTWKAATGIVGHQHAPCPNTHWDPGRLDLERLRNFMEDDVALTPKQQALLDGLEAAGVTATELNYLVANLRRQDLPATGNPAAQWALGFARDLELTPGQAAKRLTEPADTVARDGLSKVVTDVLKLRDDFKEHRHPDDTIAFTLGKVDPDTEYLDHTHPKETITVKIDPPA